MPQLAKSLCCVLLASVCIMSVGGVLSFVLSSQ